MRRCVSSVLVLVLLVTSVTDLSLHLALAGPCTRSSLSSSPGAASTTPTRPPLLGPLFPSLDQHPLVLLVVPRQLFLLSSVSLLLRLHLELLCLCPHPCRASSSSRAGRSDEEDESAEQRVQSKREQVVEELEWTPMCVSCSSQRTMSCRRRLWPQSDSRRSGPRPLSTSSSLTSPSSSSRLLAVPRQHSFEDSATSTSAACRQPVASSPRPTSSLSDHSHLDMKCVQPWCIARGELTTPPTQLHPAREARRGHGEPLSSRHV